MNFCLLLSVQGDSWVSTLAFAERSGGGGWACHTHRCQKERSPRTRGHIQGWRVLGANGIYSIFTPHARKLLWSSMKYDPNCGTQVVLLSSRYYTVHNVTISVWFRKIQVKRSRRTLMWTWYAPLTWGILQFSVFTYGNMFVTFLNMVMLYYILK